MHLHLLHSVQVPRWLPGGLQQPQPIHPRVQTPSALTIPLRRWLYSSNCVVCWRRHSAGALSALVRPGPVAGTWRAAPNAPAPNQRPVDSAPAPIKTQAERFLMPYFFSPLSDARPTITGISAKSVALGGSLTLTYSGAVTHAVLAAPAAVTHQVGGGGAQCSAKLQSAGGLWLRLLPWRGRAKHCIIRRCLPKRLVAWHALRRCFEAPTAPVSKLCQACPTDPPSLQTNMHQRLIKLATTANTGGAITVVAPPNGLVAAPGWCGAVGGLQGRKGTLHRAGPAALQGDCMAAPRSA